MKQLTELMADLIPTVDKLAQNQEVMITTVNQLAETTKENNMTSTKLRLEMSEMRLSNMRLAEAIEKLVVKIDKIDQFEERLIKLEKIVLK